MSRSYARAGADRGANSRIVRCRAWASSTRTECGMTTWCTRSPNASRSWPSMSLVARLLWARVMTRPEIRRLWLSRNLPDLLDGLLEPAQARNRI